MRRYIVIILLSILVLGSSLFCLNIYDIQNNIQIKQGIDSLYTTYELHDTTTNIVLTNNIISNDAIRGNIVNIDNSVVITEINSKKYEDYKKTNYKSTHFQTIENSITVDYVSVINQTSIVNQLPIYDQILDLSNDIYEDDDDYTTATQLFTNRTLKRHTFYPTTTGDDDWSYIELNKGVQYAIRTEDVSSYPDTYLRLYDENISLLASHDDYSAIDFMSEIIWTATYTGRHYIKNSPGTGNIEGAVYDIYAEEDGINNTVECYNNFEWKSCESLNYLETIAKIRTTANYFSSSVTNVNFTLTNIDDNFIYFNNAATFDDSYYVLDNDDILYSESGDWKITTYVETDDGQKSSKEYNWNIRYGNIEPFFISSPNTVLQNYVFTVQTGVKCIGGECNNITAILDPINEELLKIDQEEMEIIVFNKKIEPIKSNLPFGMNANVILKPDRYTTTANKKQIRDLIDDPTVENVFLNSWDHIHTDFSVPYIGASAAWNDLGYTGKGYSVCVLDSGVDYNSLGGCFGAGCKVIGGYDFINGDSDPMDDNGHGTHVAGTIAGNNTPYLGVAPDASILAMKVCNADGSCLLSAEINAMQWCLDHKDEFNIVAISMSFGSGNNEKHCVDARDGLMQNLNNVGISSIASSGNDGYNDGISAPACSSYVQAVGSSNDDDTRSWFSNTGLPLDIYAPGTAITSNALGGGFSTKQGTSMSAPHVSGATILLKEHFDTIGVNMDILALQDMLKATGVSVDSNGDFPRNRVDLTNAMKINKGDIPMTVGATPFYSLSQNPVNSDYVSCLANIKGGSTCNQTWQVNATGPIGSSWTFFTKYKVNNNLQITPMWTVNITEPIIIYPSILNVTINTTPNSKSVDGFVNYTINNTPASIMWDMENDGTIDYTTDVFSHTYDSFGEKNINITICDNLNLCVSEIKIISLIENIELSFSSSVDFNYGEKSINGNIEPTGNLPFTYKWDTDNNGITDYTTKTIAHTYDNFGTKIINITVCNTNSCKSQIKNILLEENTIPTVALASDKVSGIEPLDIQFFYEGVSGGNGDLTYALDVNLDGTIDYTDSTAPKHTFFAGSYNPTLTICDRDNDCYSSSMSFDVSSNMPKVSAEIIASGNFALQVGKVPFTVKLNSSATDGYGELTYKWDVDSNGVDDYLGHNITHTYNLPGEYDAKIEICDSINNCNSTILKFDILSEEEYEALRHIGFSIDTTKVWTANYQSDETIDFKFELLGASERYFDFKVRYFSPYGNIVFEDPAKNKVTTLFENKLANPNYEYSVKISDYPGVFTKTGHYQFMTCDTQMTCQSMYMNSVLRQVIV